MTRSSYSQHHVLFTVCVSFVLFVFLGPGVSHGATYYVSLTGNDANSGTSTSAPFKTFARAVKPLRPGDTLYIRGGLWTQQINLAGTNINGTATGWITISGYPGETVTIRYADPSDRSYGPIRARANSYMIYQNLILDGANGTYGSGWLITSNNVIVRNIEVKNFRDNGLKITANNVQVIKCKIHDSIPASTVVGQGAYFYGIYVVTGSNVLIQGNEIHKNSGGGLHAYPGPISDLVVRNNSIHHNNYIPQAGVGGITLQGSSGKNIKNTRIYNNLVYKNGNSTSGGASGILVSYYTNGTKVWNNTVYGNKTYGIQIGYSTTTTNTTVQNNITYGNGAGNYVNKGTGTIYANNLTADPKFVNSSSNNFQLQPSSPAIDKGLVLSNVTIDYKNSPRPRYSSHDIGGYEY